VCCSWCFYSQISSIVYDAVSFSPTAPSNLPLWPAMAIRWPSALHRPIAVSACVNGVYAAAGARLLTEIQSTALVAPWNVGHRSTADHTADERVGEDARMLRTDGTVERYRLWIHTTTDWLHRTFRNRRLVSFHDVLLTPINNTVHSIVNKRTACNSFCHCEVTNNLILLSLSLSLYAVLIRCRNSRMVI